MLYKNFYNYILRGSWWQGGFASYYVVLCVSGCRKGDPKPWFWELVRHGGPKPEENRGSIYQGFRFLFNWRMSFLLTASHPTGSRVCQEEDQGDKPYIVFIAVASDVAFLYTGPL